MAFSRWFLVFAMLFASAALGRAGGGHSFGGGGGHSSGGSHSSSSGGHNSSGSSSGSCNADEHGVCSGAYPIVFIFGGIFALVALLIIKAAIFGAKTQKSGPRQSRVDTAKNQAALRAKDPNFSEPQFLGRVTKGFVAVQTAWNRGDLATVRGFLSDATHERFKALLAFNAKLGFANRTEGLKVEPPKIAAFSSDALYDSITVEFTATCRDFDARPDGKVLRDELASFTEYWTFVRRVTAKSLQVGLMEGNCPSCGAKLTLTDKTECAYCQTVVSSGKYDWVLAEITQASVVDAPRSSGLQQALAKLSQLDPGFNCQVLEDRVSTLFWQRRTAELAEDRKFFKNIGVGAVNVVGAELAGNSGEANRLSFEVVWDGAPFGQENAAPMLTNLTIARAGSVQTDVKLGFLSLRCPACGAPGAASGVCSRCKAHLADEKKDWALIRFEDRRDDNR